MAKEQKKELTAEEKTEKREGERQVALLNLKATHLQDLASAYFVEESGQYGEEASSALEVFKYLPALKNASAYDIKTGQEYDIGQEVMLGSRAGKKRYTGNLSEYKVIEQSATVLAESLNALKVDDLAEIGAIDGELKEKYAGKYISELGKDEQKLIHGAYQTWLSQTKVSEALEEKAKSTKKTLESVLVEPDEKEKGKLIEMNGQPSQLEQAA